jgi:hypothetical protein
VWLVCTRNLGDHPTLLSIFPIDKIQPTPFQRDLYDAHYKRLADVINKTGHFLDPVIAIGAQLAFSGHQTAGIPSRPCGALGQSPSLL